MTFNFITDEHFRVRLQADEAEMRSCMEQGAWKAVHVLAGSIVEAVLVDYLIGAGVASPSKPEEMTLSQLISAARKDGVLTQKTAELSAALKSYRNLIHPGRALRLKETADRDGAIVAQALVAIVVREVATKLQEKHGLTAEQIIAKFESDPSALAIAEHLLSDAQEHEIERLLVSVLPTRYFDEAQSEWADDSVLDGHTKLFRAAFDQAADATKGAAMARYVTVLKEESGPRVRAYEEEFFSARDLRYVADTDRDLVIDHLLSRIGDEATVKLLRAAEGIGAHLKPSAVNAFVDPLIRLAVAQRGTQLGKGARSLLEGESATTPAELDPLIVQRLEAWVRTFESGARKDDADLVKEITFSFELFGLEP